MNKKYIFSYIPDIDAYMVDADLNQAALHGASEAVQASGMSPYLKFKYNTEHCIDINRLEDSFINNNNQVDVDVMYPALVSNNLISATIPRFLLVSKDLVPGNRQDYILGFGMKETGIAVQSLYRFKKLNREAGRLAVRHIAGHEMGHMLGLDSETIIKVSQIDGHCENECRMKQVNSALDAAQLAYKLRNRRMGGFCLDCISVLREIHS